MGQMMLVSKAWIHEAIRGHGGSPYGENKGLIDQVGL